MAEIKMNEREECLKDMSRLVRKYSDKGVVTILETATEMLRQMVRVSERDLNNCSK